MKVSAPSCLLRRLGSSNRTARAFPGLYRARVFCCGIPQWLGAVWEQQLERKGHPEKNGMGTAGYMHGRFWNRTGGIFSFWDQAQKLTKTTLCSGPQSKMPEWNCVLLKRWVSTTGFGTAGELAGDSTPAVICQKAGPLLLPRWVCDVLHFGQEGHNTKSCECLPNLTPYPYYAEWSVKHTKLAAHHAPHLPLSDTVPPVSMLHGRSATRKGVWYWSWTLSHLTSGPGW